MDNYGLTTFSRHGKLDQIDYALEAMSRGESSIGICAKNGVVLASEKKLSSVMIDEESFHKIEYLGTAKGIAFAGLSADFRALLLKGRKEYQKFFAQYNSAITTRRISEE